MCWGSNDTLESDPSVDAGGATPPAVGSPTLVAGVSGATHVAVGLAHSCALLGDQTVVCWGYNGAEMVGNDACQPSCGPTPVTDVSHAVAIAAALDETCVALDDGGVWCWGVNDFGDLGRGNVSGGKNAGPAQL
jgi:alpha-tubulin suppressor-like RCC1 family protein